MPLRSLSGSEGEKFLAAARKADSSLARSLSEYFRGIAGVEAADFRKPNPKALKAAAQYLESSRKHLQDSREAAGQMLKSRPKGCEQMVTLRLTAMLENTRVLDGAIGALQKQLLSGKYPAMRDCLGLLTALDPIWATFKVNAQVHQAEGR